MEDKTNTFFEDYQAMMLAVETLKADATNPFFNSKYVSLKDILAEVKKVCKEHNFIFFQSPGVRFLEGKSINVLNTTIKHKDGDKISGEIELVAKDTSDPQKIGSSITYMRRYSLTTMFGIEETDDDAQAGAKPKPKPKKANPKKIELIKKMLEANQKTDEAILKTLKIKSLEEISETQADGIINKLQEVKK